MAQWEGVEGDKSNWRGSAHARESTTIKVPPILAKVGFSTGDLLKEWELFETAITTSDDQPFLSYSLTDRTPKKPGPTSAHSNFTKSGSASSAMSATSTSAPSGGQLSSKSRKNSMGMIFLMHTWAIPLLFRIMPQEKFWRMEWSHRSHLYLWIFHHHHIFPPIWFFPH